MAAATCTNVRILSAARSAASPIVKSVLISTLAAVSAEAWESTDDSSSESCASSRVSGIELAPREQRCPYHQPCPVLVRIPHVQASCFLRRSLQPAGLRAGCGRRIRPPISGSFVYASAYTQRECTACVSRAQGGLHCWHVTVALDARLESMSGTTQPLFDLTLTQEQALMRESVRRFASNELRANSRKADEAGEAPKGFADKALELGFNCGARSPRSSAASARRARRSATC